jgi:hypothetical protein
MAYKTNLETHALADNCRSDTSVRKSTTSETISHYTLHPKGFFMSLRRYVAMYI